MNSPYSIPVIGFAAWSGSGKTTLIERLIPLLQQRGIRLAYIKHAHHQVEFDQPGKDSHRMRMAGANPVILASSKRWALFTETPEQQEPKLCDLIHSLPLESLDLVVVEGFKHEPIPKIEIIRQDLDKPPLPPHDESFIAVATNHDDYHPKRSLPALELDSPETIAQFIQAWIDKDTSQ